MPYRARAIPLLVVPLALTSFALPAASRQPAQPFAQAELFVELNDTDGDLGLHARSMAERGRCSRSTTRATARCSASSAPGVFAARD